MQEILIGGDRALEARLLSWMAAWGLAAGRLPDGMHPARVPADRASAVVYACDSRAAALTPEAALAGPMAQATAPLLLLGGNAPPDLLACAWLRVADPGPQGATLAAALKPCLEAVAGSCAGTGFQDLVNHEMRTPLTAAGTALQTLAMQMVRVGGPALDLVDVALRNIRRLERTVDWACDFMVEGAGEAPIAPQTSDIALVDLLEDLDDLARVEPLTWSTEAGDWHGAASVDRESWRRLLRQMLRAIRFLPARQPVHCELSLLPSGSESDPSPSGLLVVINLPYQEAFEQEGAVSCDPDAQAEQLRRLLAFTVNPALARRLDLRFDVMRLAERLRLRLMLPLAGARECLLCN